MNLRDHTDVEDLVTDDAANSMMHRCIDKARANDIDPDAVRCEFGGRACRQADLSVLGRNIRSSATKTEERVYRSDIDDRSTTPAIEHRASLVFQTQIITL